VLIFAILSLGMSWWRLLLPALRAAIPRRRRAPACGHCGTEVGELAQYRKERLEDAAIFFENAAFSGLVRRFFDHPEDADAQRQIQEWTVKLVATGQYDLVRLLDAQGVTRLSSPAGAPPISSAVSQRIPEILRLGQVTFQDFHRNEHDQRVYLDILIPILDEQNASRPLGVFYLRINRTSIFIPSSSAGPCPARRRRRCSSGGRETTCCSSMN